VNYHPILSYRRQKEDTNGGVGDNDSRKLQKEWDLLADSKFVKFFLLSFLSSCVFRRRPLPIPNQRVKLLYRLLFPHRPSSALPVPCTA